MTRIPSHAFAALVSLAVVPHVGHAQPVGADATALFASFTLAPGVEWATVSIPLAPQHWHVGRADGPAPSAARLGAVLTRIAQLQIGANCARWEEGATAYACGFAVDSLSIGERAVTSHPVVAFDWSPTGETGARALERKSPELRRSGLLAPLQAPMRFVPVDLSARKIGAAVPGEPIQFRFRAVSNPLVPSTFDRSSGTIVIRGALPVSAGL